METAQFYILAVLSGISIALCAVLLYKIRSVIYLLEQPVVKKMSPQLKLKPVKVDELDDESRRNQNRNGNSFNANRNPNPNGRPFERNEGQSDRPPRDGQPRQDRMPRSDRPEGDRGPRNDRFRDRGDRDRGGRHDRHERHGGPDRGGDRNRRPEVFSNDKEGGAPADAQRSSEPMHRSAPMHASEAPASQPTLAPRRPLPSTVEHEVETKDIPMNEPSAAADGSESFVGRGDDSDMQHGRRHVPKKKPRFDISEEEVKATTEETKA